jgi:TRAP-type C4-dicarboxylate transport system permease small subunit
MIVTRAAAFVRRSAEWIAALLFGAIVLTFGANIVARYIFSRPIIWADELVVVLLIWVTFLTAALVTQEREQVIFDLLYERLSPAGRRGMLIIGSALLAGILAAALPAVISYTAFLWRERTNVLEWRLDRVYSCFAFFLVVLVIRRLALIVGLLRADWRRTLAAVEGRDAPAGDRP